MRTSKWIVLGVLGVSSVAAADPPSETAPAAPQQQAAPAAPLRVYSWYSVRHHEVEWTPLVGDAGISQPAFLHLVGKDDVADALSRHRGIAVASLAGAAIAGGIAVYELAHMNDIANWGSCLGGVGSPPPQMQVQTCIDNANAAQAQDNASHEAPMWIAAGASVGLFGLAVYEMATAPRVSEADAVALARQYNATHVAPYATPDGGGVQLDGHF